MRNTYDDQPPEKDFFNWQSVKWIGFISGLIGIFVFVTGRQSIGDIWRTQKKGTVVETSEISQQLPEQKKQAAIVPRPNNQPLTGFTETDTATKQVDQSDYYFEKFREEAQNLQSSYNREYTRESYSYNGTPLKRLYDSTLDIIKTGYIAGDEYAIIQQRYLQAVITVANIDLITLKDTAHALKLYDGVLRTLDTEPKVWSRDRRWDISTILFRLADILIVRNKLPQALRIVAKLEFGSRELSRYSNIFYGSTHMFFSVSKARDFKAGDVITVKYNPLKIFLDDKDEPDYRGFLENLGVFLAKNEDIQLQYTISPIDKARHRLVAAEMIRSTFSSHLSWCCRVDYDRIVPGDTTISKDKYNYIILKLLKTDNETGGVSKK